MKILNHPQFYFRTLILLSLAPFSAFAQENSDPPKPAARTYLGGLGAGTQDQEANTQNELKPDQASLTGAQVMTLGSPELRHSYWVPGFQLENVFSSQDPSSTKPGQWYSTTYLLGNLSLLEAWRNSELSMNYTAGGVASSSSNYSGNYYHQLGLSQTFDWHRWQIRFLDQFSYMPQSSFGFGGVSGVATPGVGGTLGEALPNLQTNYIPYQSIFAAIGPRYSNGFVTQAEYALTRRSSLTAVGSFGILRFTQGNSVDANDAIFSLGYSYQLTARDSFGVLYRFTGYRYPGNPQALNDHTAQLAYGRRITGRLALQLAGGPDVTTFRVPSSANQINFSMGASLTYAFKRSHFGLTYSRGLTAGSGVLTGSRGDEIQLRLAHQILRQWLGTGGFGYARNQQILGVSTTGPSATFNSAFGSAGLGHSLGRAASISANYTFSYSSQTQTLCAAAACQPSFKQHQIWLGITWHASPFVLR